MTMQNISTLEATPERIGPISWVLGGRVALASIIFSLIAAIGSVTPQLTEVLTVITTSGLILIPYLVLAYFINQPVHGTSLAIAHDEYGYLVQEHLTHGVASDAGWAFIWRFVILYLALLLIFGIGEVCFAAIFWNMKAVLHAIQKVLNEPMRYAVLNRLLPVLFFLPAKIGAFWAASRMTLGWLVRHPARHFAYLLVPT